MQRATTGSMSRENQVTEDLIGENRLWTAVIVNAVEDWRFGTLRARREAQAFLFDDHADFETVCGRAGLEPDTFRSKLLKIGRRIEMEGGLDTSAGGISFILPAPQGREQIDAICRAFVSSFNAQRL